MWTVWQLASCETFESLDEALAAMTEWDPDDDVGDGGCSLVAPDGVTVPGATHAEVAAAARRLERR